MRFDLGHRGERCLQRERQKASQIGEEDDEGRAVEADADQRQRPEEDQDAGDSEHHAGQGIGQLDDELDRAPELAHPPLQTVGEGDRGQREQDRGDGREPERVPEGANGDGLAEQNLGEFVEGQALPGERHAERRSQRFAQKREEGQAELDDE